MAEPPIVLVRYLEHQCWPVEDVVAPKHPWTVELHREDGPAWVIITPNGAIHRWVRAGKELREVHPMGRGEKPNYWVRPIACIGETKDG